jgi:hypothetical protein
VIAAAGIAVGAAGVAVAIRTTLLAKAIAAVLA